MKKLSHIKIIVVVILLLNCCSIQKDKELNLDFEQIRIIVMNDFSKNYKTPRRYLKERKGTPFNVFVFTEETEINDVLMFSILPKTSEISISTTDIIGKVPRNNIPNKYYIKNGKLFLWNDKKTPLNKDVLNILHQYQVLDSTDIKKELGLLSADFIDNRMISIDDRLKGVHYYICKNNSKRYKKVNTNIAFGYYKPPKTRCK